MSPSPHEIKARLTVYLLGGLRVYVNGQLLSRPFPTGKTVSLFAFLLLQPGRAFTRDYLAELFWPEVDVESARGSLKSALLPIRRVLEPREEDRGRVLASPRNLVLFNPPESCWVDVWEIERLLGMAEAASPHSPDWFEALENAVPLYRGPLLPERDDDWCRQRRVGLSQWVVNALHDLTRADQERKQYARACEWARRAVELDPCDEVSHRHLMLLYALMHDDARALQQYQECRRALRERLSAPPDPETHQLYQWLKLRAEEKAPFAATVRGSHFSPILSVISAPPLVGRQFELGLLQAAWHRACGGEGALILLAGESGIGKSRLAEQFLYEVGMAGGLAIHGTAYRLERDSLYQPLIDPLRQARSLAEEHGLSPATPVWTSQVAWLLPELQEEEEIPAVAEESRKLVEGIGEFFLSLARQRPLCLCLDDLQWADVGTGRLLQYLAHRAPRAPLLLLGTYRVGELTDSDWLQPTLTELKGQRLASVLLLPPLKAAEIEELLDQLAEGQLHPRLLPPLAARLLAETEGNPFYLLEKLRQWFEAGLITVAADGAWGVADALLRPLGPRRLPDQDAARLPPPAAVQAVLQQRVSRLSEEDQEALACAAIIGRRFSFEVLQRATGRDQEATLSSLERLLAADLIATSPRADAYDFRHDLIREVVTASLTPLRRQQWHQRIGDALQGAYALTGEEWRERPTAPIWMRASPPSSARARAEERAEELAWHFHQAAPLIGPEMAARYYYLAGVRARALCVYDAAVRNLSTARELLEGLPLESTRRTLWAQTMELLAPAYRGALQTEAARKTCEEYIARSEEMDYPHGIARGCILMGWFLELHPHLAAPHASRTFYERALALCKNRGLDHLIARAYSSLASYVARYDGDLERAEELASSGLPHAEGIGDHRVIRRLHGILMLVAAARSDWEGLRHTFQNSLRYGGPEEYSLIELLDQVEEACHRTGAEETFRALCDDMAAGYTRAGLEPPLRQWYLLPATPLPPPGTPAIEEEFLGDAWNPELIWLDSSGASRHDTTSRLGWLGILPAVGTNLWPEQDVSAPRLVTVVAEASSDQPPEGAAVSHKGHGAGVTGVRNVIAETRMEISATGRILAGLLLWQDEANFVRLELQRQHEEHLIVCLGACLSGRFHHIGRGRCELAPLWLRLERTRERIRGLCSPDGAQWRLVGELNLPYSASEQIGLAACHFRDTDTVAWFDRFVLWREPETG